MTLNSKFLVVILGAVFSWSAQAKDGVLDVQRGQKTYFHYSIANPSKITLVLLPGIYRGLNEDDQIISILKQKKINYVAIHFSGHPSSILQLNESESPLFKNGKGLTSQLLADEVSAVVMHLKLKKPVPVSLSYSSTVVPFLDVKQFPVVIETAPIGAFGEDDPVGTAQRQAWANWLKLWPGNYFWIEAAKDKAYRDHWQPIAESRADQYDGINVSLMTEGYMAMARATEDFDIRKQDFKNTAKRIWILAENEDEYRRSLQDEAVQIYNSVTKVSELPYEVADSGHIIPTEQPEAYSQILIEILSALKL